MVYVLFLTFLIWTGCSSSNATAPGPAPAAEAAPVRVAKAENRRAPLEVSAVGNVEAYTTIVTRSPIGGILMKVFFQEGQSVRKGDPLFEIDTRPYREAIHQLEANLAKDRATLQQAEASFNRAQQQDVHYGTQANRYLKLAEQGIFSQEAADQASLQAKSARTAVRLETASIASAKAAIAATEAAIANAKLNLSYCFINSPINGRTGALQVKEGNLIKANDVELVTIHQLQPVFVTFAVPEEHLTIIRQRAAAGKLPVAASIPNDSRPGVSGTVSFLDNAVDRDTGTIRLKATFPNADSRLWPGQFVDVRLLLEDRPNAIVVPAAALQTGQQGNYVYVVKSDQSVEMRTVTPGPRAGIFTSITSGLQPEERVVTEGALRLAPGMKVKVLGQ